MLQGKTLVKGTGLLRFLVFLAALILSFSCAEIGVRIFCPQQLILNLKIWKPEPLIGWRHWKSLNTVVNMGERNSHFVTDERGYRVNAREQNAPSSAFADLSVLMIGDSFLEALAIENEESIPERIKQMLERKYPLRVHAVNAGVGGWQPGQYLLEARHALKEARYDFGVVFFYMENDLVDKLPLAFTPQDIAPATRLRYPRRLWWEDLKKDVFYPVNNYLEQRSQFFVFLKNRFPILLARMRLTPYYFPDIFYRKEAGSPKWDVAAATAQLIKNEFQQVRTPVLFVLLPADYQVYPSLIARYIKMFDIRPEEIDLSQPNQKLIERFRDKAIPVMDMLPVFKQKAEQGVALYGAIDNHMNVQGHVAVAEAIYPWFEQNLKISLLSRTGSHG